MAFLFKFRGINIFLGTNEGLRLIDLIVVDLIVMVVLTQMLLGNVDSM